MKKTFSNFVLYYLRFLARFKLAQAHPIIIGVTGSAGKTSCVAAIEAILKEKYQVKTTGGTNSESGIPLSILDLKMTDYSPFDWLKILTLAPLRYLLTANRYEILVCEMGIDDLKPPKNMEYLLTIVQPRIGVFLNALPVHTEQMQSVDNIAAEKGKLIQSLPRDGVAILNAEDPRVAAFKEKTAAKVILFQPVSIATETYALTDDYRITFAAAIAVASLFGFDQTESKNLIKKNFQLPPGRGQILPGINRSSLIDSSYNASPVTVLSALDFLMRTLLNKESPSRRIAVLGDMRELGDLVEKYHQEIARKAYLTADAVITVGPLCKKYFPKDTKLTAQFDTSFEAGKFLQKYLRPGDLVLFKGSQNTIFLETAVEMCLMDKRDTAKLCRRCRKHTDHKEREKLK